MKKQKAEIEALEKERRLKEQEFNRKQEVIEEQARGQAAQRAAEREREERA